MKLSDEDRKRLTEFLGEVFHEDRKTYDTSYYSKHVMCTCGNEIREENYSYHQKLGNRTFTTPHDTFALKDKLIDIGKWWAFESYCWEKVWEQKWCYQDKIYPSFAFWLFRLTDENGDPHFSSLVSTFLKELNHE